MSPETTGQEKVGAAISNNGAYQLDPRFRSRTRILLEARGIIDLQEQFRFDKQRSRSSQACRTSNMQDF
jgi:hypothetical protein